MQRIGYRRECVDMRCRAVPCGAVRRATPHGTATQRTVCDVSEPLVVHEFHHVVSGFRQVTTHFEILLRNNTEPRRQHICLQFLVNNPRRLMPSRP